MIKDLPFGIVVGVDSAVRRAVLFGYLSGAIWQNEFIGNLTSRPIDYDQTRELVPILRKALTGLLESGAPFYRVADKTATEVCNSEEKPLL